MKPKKSLFLFSLFIFLFSLCIACSSPTSSDDDEKETPPSALSYTGKTLPTGTMGFPYEQNLATATGATGISYTLASGSSALPAGLSLSSAGMLTGTPSDVVTNAAFSVTASASGYTSATANFSFSIDFITMASIPGGTFQMGSPGTEPNRGTDETQHSAEVSDFQMSKYQITQAQFKSLMGFNPSNFQGAKLPAGLANGDNLPVENVTWFDAVAFCNKLSDEEDLFPVYTISGTITTNAAGNITAATVTANWSADGYRLPTEAEWEYACRGSYDDKATETNTRPFGLGNGNKITYDLANFDTHYPYDLTGTPSGQYNDTAGMGNKNSTTEVGSYSANNYGLYDMHGNVFEWCWDWNGTYPPPGEKDYRGPGSGSYHVMRGGSWDVNGQNLRSASRNYDYPSSWHSNYGFRVVLN